MTAPQTRIKGRLGLSFSVAAEKPSQRREGHQTIRVRSAKQLSQSARSSSTSDEPKSERKPFYTKKKVGPEVRAKGEAILEQLKADSPHFFGDKPKLMALGLHRAIREKYDLSASVTHFIVKAISYPIAYKAATAVPGAQRYDLDGNAVDEVTDAHRQHAMKNLMGIKRARDAGKERAERRKQRCLKNKDRPLKDGLTDYKHG